MKNKWFFRILAIVLASLFVIPALIQALFYA